MRIELDPQPMSFELAGKSVPEELAEEGAERVIGGLVVPYGEPALIMGQEITFAEGSVHAAEHVPLVLNHDLDRPIGVMKSHANGSAGFSGIFAVDETRDGDSAIIQARSGSRRGLSGGLDVIRFSETESGGMVVEEAALAEVSQVTLAAFRSAAIETVRGAQSTDGGSDKMADPTPAQAPELELAGGDPPELAAQRAPIIVTARRDEPRMRLGQFVQTMARAMRGDRSAGAMIQAALDRQELADEPGVVPIAYVSSILDSLGAERVLFDAFSKAELPPAGMTIRRPVVNVRPNGGWLATDADPAPSGPITIGQYDTPVEQWAHAVAASVALVERSSPSFVEEAYRQMVLAYYRAVEAKIGAQLETITPPATSPPTTIGGAGALFTGAYGSWPNLIVAGPVAYGEIVDATGAMRFSSGSADLGGNATIAGVRVVCAPNVTAADVWVTRSELFESRESSPIRISANDVSSLSLEFGVTSFYALAITLQALGGVSGAVRIAGYVPAAADTSSTAQRKSSK